MHHKRAHVCVRVCARACACVFGRTRIRAKSPRRNERAFSHRRRPHALRLAGVYVGIGVQCGHRRVEHRACHDVVPGVRRSWPAARHRGGHARPGLDAARPLCAVVLPMRARVVARTHVWALGRAGVNVCTYSGASERWNICMYSIIYWDYIYVRKRGVMMDRLHVHMRWRSQVAATAVHCICSTTKLLPPYHCRIYPHK